MPSADSSATGVVGCHRVELVHSDVSPERHLNREGKEHAVSEITFILSLSLFICNQNRGDATQRQRRKLEKLYPIKTLQQNWNGLAAKA